MPSSIRTGHNLTGYACPYLEWPWHGPVPAEFITVDGGSFTRKSCADGANEVGGEESRKGLQSPASTRRRARSPPDEFLGDVDIACILQPRQLNGQVAASQSCRLRDHPIRVGRKSELLHAASTLTIGWRLTYRARQSPHQRRGSSKDNPWKSDSLGGADLSDPSGHRRCCRSAHQKTRHPHLGATNNVGQRQSADAFGDPSAYPYSLVAVAPLLISVMTLTLVKDVDASGLLHELVFSKDTFTD